MECLAAVPWLVACLSLPSVAVVMLDWTSITGPAPSLTAVCSPGIGPLDPSIAPPACERATCWPVPVTGEPVITTAFNWPWSASPCIVGRSVSPATKEDSHTVGLPSSCPSKSCRFVIVSMLVSPKSCPCCPCIKLDEASAAVLSIFPAYLCFLFSGVSCMANCPGCFSVSSILPRCVSSVLISACPGMLPEGFSLSSSSSPSCSSFTKALWVSSNSVTSKSSKTPSESTEGELPSSSGMADVSMANSGSTETRFPPSMKSSSDSISPAVLSLRKGCMELDSRATLKYPESRLHLNGGEPAIRFSGSSASFFRICTASVVSVEVTCLTSTVLSCCPWNLLLKPGSTRDAISSSADICIFPSTKSGRTVTDSPNLFLSKSSDSPMFKEEMFPVTTDSPNGSIFSMVT